MRQDSEEQYIPIEVDFSMPRKHERNTRYGKWCKFLLLLQDKIGLLIYTDLTYENQINEQLKNRKKFPQSEWEKCFKDVKKIEKILKEVAEVIGRVNHHYIPSDLLLYALWDDAEDDTSLWLSLELRDVFGVEPPPEDIVAMAKKNMTLKDFFNDFFKQKD